MPSWTLLERGQVRLFSMQYNNPTFGYEDAVAKFYTHE